MVHAAAWTMKRLPSYFLKAVRVVDRGEIWVTRKMLGKIMDKVLH